MTQSKDKSFSDNSKQSKSNKEYQNEFQRHENLAVRYVEELFKYDPIFQFRKEMPEYHCYDVTIQSGSSNTILLTEVKIRNHPYGYYDSTILEEQKYENIMNEYQKLRIQYPEYIFIPTLLTFYSNGIHTLHKLEDENYNTEKIANHQTVQQSNNIQKNFINYNIQNYERKWVRTKENQT